MVAQVLLQIDYPRVVHAKIERIKNCELLRSSVEEWSVSEGSLISKNYSILGCDLTKLDLLEKMLIQCELDFKLPTLIISECVLTYIHPEKYAKLHSYSA